MNSWQAVIDKIRQGKGTLSTGYESGILRFYCQEVYAQVQRKDILVILRRCWTFGKPRGLGAAATYGGLLKHFAQQRAL